MSAVVTSIPSQAAIELVDVDCWAGSSGAEPLLTGVHWTVEPGTFWVVGGLLGTGKTHLLSTIAGLHPPARGTVKVLGSEWSDHSPDQLPAHRLKVALIQGGGLLLHHLSIEENVALPLCYHHNAQTSEVMPRLRDWMVATELEPFAHRIASSISRNWSQRAGLVRACSVQPEILLLDNPLSGLDPQHVRWWMKFLAEVQEGHPLLGYRRLTVIVTCDDIDVWRAPGRRYGTLADGRFCILEG